MLAVCYFYDLKSRAADLVRGRWNVGCCSANACGMLRLWGEVAAQGPAAGDAGRAGGPSVPSP